MSVYTVIFTPSAVVIDLFSRMVIGWSMDKTMKAQLVNDDVAILFRKHSLIYTVKNFLALALILHRLSSPLE